MPKSALARRPGTPVPSAPVSRLVVIGPDAPAVARAIDPDAWVLDEGDATPAVAARHRGAELDPETLLREAREHDVVGLRGDLVSPLTPRFSIRDLALQLAAPVVLTDPALYGITGGARLAVEAALGAGLAVAAVVLTAWPDPPDRVLIDERVLLHEVTDVPVLTLGIGERPDWPVEDWYEAAPATRRAEPVRVALDPYRAWDGDVPGDPRSAPRPRIMDALTEIIATEGPMLASRAYALYNRAAGGKKLTSVARAPLSNSVYHLAREGKVALTRAEDVPWQNDDVVRLPDSPPVVVRQLGPRELIEVPLDEIAELMRRLDAAGQVDDRKRAVLNAYGLVRMTARAEQYLTTAEELL
jgi:hypothetical protein